MTGFEGAVPALGQALTKRGYTVLTPVQEAVLAPELIASDLLVSAQTGSGKTVAFGMAIAPTLLDGAERFDRANVPLALVVAPTRELALQVKKELEWLYADTGAVVVSCVGGMDMRTERQVLGRGAHIVVGTPGRLRDHIQRRSFNASELKAVVLDEADEMLDMGFRDDLEFILDASPEERRTLMFSATVPRSITGLAKRYQRDAVRVTTAEEKEQHLDIDYRALTVAPADRENAIVNVLRYYEAKTAIVFCATRATVNRLTSRFTNRGFSVVALSGELSQNERTHALQALRDGRARVCVATDVAARGLDLPNLELVIHGDLPDGAQSLLHRSGRTGRAGRKGVSVLIVPHSWRKRTERLLENAKIEATWARPPSVDEIVQRDDERILADPALAEPVKEEEQAFVKALLAEYGPDKLAAAFVRLYRAGQSAPEDLVDTAPFEGSVRQREEPRSRDDFKNSAWISLSVGHTGKAEARWLLPMLCRLGNITKRDIGAIRIQQEETYVELAPNSVEGFLAAIGPGMDLERGIKIERQNGPPAGRSGGQSSGRDKPYADKKPYARSKPEHRGKPGNRYDPLDKSGSPSADREPREQAYEKKKPYGDGKPGARGRDDDRSSPSDGKKPWKKKEGGNKPAGKSHASKPYAKKKPYGGSESGPGDREDRRETSAGGKKPWKKTEGGKKFSDRPPAKKKPYAGKKLSVLGDGGAGDGAKKTWDKSSKKPKGTKVYTPKFDKARAKTRTSGEDGSGPRKWKDRKKSD